MKKIKWLLLLLVIFLPMLFLMGCPKSPTTPNAAWVENPYVGGVPNPLVPCLITNTGFYVQPYPGSSMSSVVLWLQVGSVSGTQSYTYNLTVRDSSYTGSVIGTASSGAVSLPHDSNYYPVTFAFGSDLSVTKNDTITFVLSPTSVPSGSNTSFCPQASNSNNVNIVLTNGTNPPLGSGSLGTGVAVVINS